MNDKKLTYAQQMAEVDMLVSQKYVAVKAAPHKGGTLKMKNLLTQWGVEGSLFASMSTDSIYKCIALGKVRCIAGFTKKGVLGDGYGTAQDVQWLMETTPVRPAAIPATEGTIVRFSPDEEDDFVPLLDIDDMEDIECYGCCRVLGYGPKGTIDYCSTCKQERIDVMDEMDSRMETIECARCLCLMGVAPRGTVDYCRSCMAIRHADNEAKKKDLAKRQELGDSLMRHGKEMVNIKDMSSKEMGVMLQGIIATKKAASAAKGAATKAAKKVGK